jgi:RNA recognition motif-containing protein
MGFGYVQMESAEAAQRTLQSLHLSNMNGEILAVSFIKRLPPGYGP